MQISWISFDIPTAFRALRALRDNPDDTKQVFTIIESLAGVAPWKVKRSFLASPEAMDLIERRPDILPVLSDRDALAAMPDGSLGRAYLAFMREEAITADGLVAASVNGSRRGGPEAEGDPTVSFILRRIRDTHDLWHVATGYGPDVKGELGLLAFNAAQTFHLGVALIVAMSIVTRKFDGAFALALEGVRRGARAKWLPGVNWEELLPLPLAEVRSRLNLGDAPSYERLYSRDLVQLGASRGFPAA